MLLLRLFAIAFAAWYGYVAIVHMVCGSDVTVKTICNSFCSLVWICSAHGLIWLCMLCWGNMLGFEVSVDIAGAEAGR